jgi:beta-glucosidase
MSFPDDFSWGAAAASYQIEGAAEAHGKGPSVWDMFCKKAGATWQGHSGSVACDHYRLYATDVAIMRELGLRAYRLSISWPRVLPDGIGSANAAGLDFYDRLVDALLKAEVAPYVTLFHWDFPLSLYEKGGWLNRDSSQWFAEYADIVTRRLSDRVTHFMTLNEPQVFIGAGHQDGRHAPGDRLHISEVLLAAHHVLMAHGRAVQAIRSAAVRPPSVGIAPVAQLSLPHEPTHSHIEVARAATFAAAQPHMRTNTWWLDPICFGHYPEDGLAFHGANAPRVRDGDLELIHQPLDYLGVNIYNGVPVRPGKDGRAENVPMPVGFPITAFDWPVTPEALYYGPKWLYERYKLPLVITENGLSCRDWVSVDGKVHDAARIDFTTRYLRELHRAIAEGVDVRGYFHWSILDNFEWAEGYKQRFGLVFVDYPTQQRIIKDSGYWYRDVIASNGAVLLA